MHRLPELKTRNRITKYASSLRVEYDIQRMVSQPRRQFVSKNAMKSEPSPLLYLVS